MRSRIAVTLAGLGCLALSACSGSTSLRYASGSGSAASQVSVTPTPAGPGTIILGDQDYSYTPLGRSPNGFQPYPSGPIQVAVGTTVVVDLSNSWVDPVSSDPQLIQPVRKASQDQSGNDVANFRAVRTGMATIVSPAKCPKISTLPCHGAFAVNLNIS
jgi:hypothetical protein